MRNCAGPLPRPLTCLTEYVLHSAYCMPAVRNARLALNTTVLLLCNIPKMFLIISQGFSTECTESLSTTVALLRTALPLSCTLLCAHHRTTLFTRQPQCHNSISCCGACARKYGRRTWGWLALAIDSETRRITVNDATHSAQKAGAGCLKTFAMATWMHTSVQLFFALRVRD